VVALPAAARAAADEVADEDANTAEDDGAESSADYEIA
jgi:hypothetical protein